MNKNLRTLFGIIGALVFAGIFLYSAKGERITGPSDAAGLLIAVISLGWCGYNFSTYEGRRRPAIPYLIKVCYPILFLVLYLAFTT